LDDTDNQKKENVMGLGDMMGKAAGMIGGDFDIGEKLGELGVDVSMLEDLDLVAAKSFIADKGFDLSMLDSLGLNIDDLLAKFMGGDA
jgi:hypothetical protein